MRHAGTDNLAFPGQRQHVYVQLGDHHLQPQRGVGVDGGFDMLGTRVVEAPVPLHADSVDADARRLQHPDHAHDAVALLRAPGVEVVVVKLCVRRVALGETESQTHQLVAIADAFDPGGADGSRRPHR